MTTVNEEGKALVEQSTFDKEKALAEFMEYIHTYLTDDECNQVLKAFELADKAQNLGAAEGATGLPEDTWSMKNFTVEQYKALFKKVADGEIVPDSKTPEDANNADWLKGIPNVTIDFEA